MCFDGIIKLYDKQYGINLKRKLKYILDSIPIVHNVFILKHKYSLINCYLVIVLFD